MLSTPPLTATAARPMSARTAFSALTEAGTGSAIPASRERRRLGSAAPFFAPRVAGAASEVVEFRLGGHGAGRPPRALHPHRAERVAVVCRISGEGALRETCDQRTPSVVVSSKTAASAASNEAGSASTCTAAIMRPFFP